METKYVKLQDGNYTCDLGISTDEWIGILQDEITTANYKKWLLRFYKEPEHKATCKFLSEKYSESPQTPNATISNFGKAVQRKLNRFNVAGDIGESSIYWVIPMNGKDLSGGLFEWSLRPELVEAIKRLDWHKFTWVPFYKEMAHKLLEYKDNREELVRIVYGLDRSFVDYIKDNNGNDYSDLDPFSIFAIFNRNLKKANRIEICRYFKDKLNLDADLPSDFDSIPIINNMMSVFVWRDDIQTGTQAIWVFFEEAMRRNIEQRIFSESFNKIRNQKGIKWNMTMGLFWISPYTYMPLDEKSRVYLKHIGIDVFNESNLTGESYLQLLDKIKGKIKSNEIKETNFLEISFNAGKQIEEDKQCYWSGGINWGDENKLEEFQKKGYWQIGWPKNDIASRRGAKQAWNNIKKVNIGDYFAFHGYGGRNILKIYQISKVIGIDKENGIVNLEKINSDDDKLYHDTAPKLEKGHWFGTLLPILGNEAIDKIFGEFIGDTTMNKLNEENKYISLLRANHNLIFTGAPGTGKTYFAKQIAKEMNAETAFVQFHPSYDYTDFVEGLRPIQSDGNGNIGFERKDGVFKEFCKQALQNLIDSQKSEKELGQTQFLRNKISDFVSESIDNNEPFKTKNGSVFYIKEASESHITIFIPNNNVANEVKISQNELFDLLDKNVSIENVKDIKKHFGRQVQTQEDSYTFILYNQLLKKKDNKTSEDVMIVSRKDFIFIIDEINRGEISKIFGELFFSIDPGYRGEKGTVQTQYQNLIEPGDTFKKGFYVPENVYIIGTMNDIDRSVESMDFAMRRRFTWQEITAAESAENMRLSEEVKERMARLNKAISNIEGLNSSYHIGGAYFLKLNNGEINAEELWNNHLRCLLFEYLRGMPDAENKLEELKNAYDNKDSEIAE